MTNEGEAIVTSQRLCFLMHLADGQEAEYEQRHRELWPEMFDALKRAGYTNYSLFREGTTVVGYAECVPNAASVAMQMASEPVTARWNDSFRGIIEPFAGSGAFALGLSEIWHID